MATVQSTYPENPTQWIEGQIATGRACSTLSAIVDDSNGVPWGRGVERGDDSQHCSLGCTGIDKFLGIAQRDISRDPGLDGVDKYGDGALASILTDGDIIVKVDGPVKAGGKVTVDRATGELSSGKTTANQTAWASGQAYALGATVRSGSKNYICVRAHTSATGNVADGAPNQSNATAWAEYFAFFEVPGATWMTAAADNELAMVRLTGSLNVVAK